MTDIALDKLSLVIAEKIKPFLEEILRGYPENVHSLHIVGSALTPDFDAKTSDVNSIVVLKSMDLSFIEFIAPLSKTYRKKNIAAPLIMTPDYIANSLDVFPIEFLDFRLIHETVFGEDLFRDIEIKPDDLRHQCEREIKSKLIGLRQGYISSLGDRQRLTDGFVDSIAGYMPLFRGIIYLMGKEPPVKKHDVLTMLSDATGVKTDIFLKILDIKKGQLKLSKQELDSVFEDYYASTEKIGNVIDGLQT
jgi:hypothetical protein